MKFKKMMMGMSKRKRSHGSIPLNADEDARLHSMAPSPDGKGFDIMLSHPGVAIMYEGLVKMFIAAGAVNYLETRALHKPTDEYYTILVCKQSGKTQGEIITELKAEIAMLREKEQA